MTTELKPKPTVNPIPQGYHTLTPYLYIRGAAAALEFYTRAFGARELFRFPFGDRIGHAEIQIGDSRLMLADEYPEMGVRSPATIGGNGSSLLIYLKDVDVAFKRAVDAGAKVIRPLKDQFYGDRSGTVQDPFGHQWTLATHVEDISPDEMQRRGKEEMAKKNCSEQ